MTDDLKVPEEAKLEIDEEKMYQLFQNLCFWQPKLYKSEHQIINIKKSGCKKCHKVVKHGYRGKPLIIKVTYKDWFAHDRIANYFTGDIRKKSKRWNQKFTQEEFEAIYPEKIQKVQVDKRCGHDEALYKLMRGVTNFRPTLVRTITKKFFQNKKKIRMLDPCAGWGDRLVGALSDPKIVEYVGYDINKHLIPRYKQIYNFFKDRSKLNEPTFHCEPFEKTEIAEKSYVENFDLVFTSPPYFDLEQYYSVGFEYDSVKDWKEQFLFPFAKKCKQALKPGGFLVINLNSIQKQRPLDLICPLREAVYKTKKFKYLGMISFAKVNFKKGVLGWKSPQPLFIWLKK
jgi:tRNA1(Val) A37 N6-methylase TrmN6